MPKFVNPKTFGLDGPFHESRVKVVADGLGELLYAAAVGDIEMTPIQLKSAEIMLKKVQPDLTRVIEDKPLTGGPDIPKRAENYEEWYARRNLEIPAMGAATRPTNGRH